MPTKLEIQQESQRVMQCLEDPLISAAFPEEICAATTISRDEYLTCVAHEQALARCKCEQELVRLDTALAGDTLDAFNMSFNIDEVLASLRFLYENRRIHIDELIDAAKTGHTSLVKMLLTWVDPSARYNYAIQYASARAHTDVVKVLLADPRVDPSVDFNVAIRIASEYGYTEVVKLLLADARVNPCVFSNWSIIIASQNGHTEVVKVLLADKRLSDPSAYKHAAISLAGQNGHTDVVALLLAKS